MAVFCLGAIYWKKSLYMSVIKQAMTYASSNMRPECGWVLVLVQCCFFAVVFSTFFDKTILEAANTNQDPPLTSPPLKLIQEHDHVIVDNGLSNVTLTIPDGIITGISYGGIDNLLYEDAHGHVYWDANWQRPGQESRFTSLSGTNFRVIKETPDQVELSFSTISDTQNFPLDFDRRFVMIRGVSGFYQYAIYERPNGSPDLDLWLTRIAFKLNPEKFVYMALSDTRRRIMPTADDRVRGKPLAYREAVLLTNPSNSSLRGQVDDKYAYSAESKDINVHGWISMEPGVGFWVITPSHEFIGCGPLKQHLTSHVGPTSLAVFLSNHYIGDEATAVFRNGEPWKKVFGPIFVYLNSNPQDPMALWDDAKRQWSEEVRQWPYNFPMSQEFLRSDQRATVTGYIQVRDRFIQDGTDIGARNAYVGLAPPGPGTWETETKGYQFWVQADQLGNFIIPNVIPGTYNFCGWVPGYIGAKLDLGRIVFEPPKHAPTLWEIGIPDRTAAEFFIPDPDPNLTSGLYAKNNFDRFREYGLWDRYSALYPNSDLTFTVGVSDYQKDWFYAHVPRKEADNTYSATTWKIIFNLPQVSQNAIYKLRISIASATYSELQVRINDANTQSIPHFTTGLFGRDNAIARHGIHGLYWLFNIDVPGSKFAQGSNAIYLTQSRVDGVFMGLMYDHIRLEGPVEESEGP